MASGSPVEGLADAFLPGTMLGKYELLATIGRGGMANVILARQRGPAGFEKVVVIKVIHPHMAQHRSAVNMLLDEARVAAQIDHPNVVHTHELGEAHGTFYIVMEYLAGESFNRLLAQHAVEGPLDPNMAGRIVAEAAAGLHAAHELTDFEGKSLEIVHRDVSPGNIVVLYNGNVKVVDFGIAKAHGRVTSTQDGELKGKYGYMSPEQIKNEPMDRRSDVFSLGVVMWEALSARRLFRADSVGATLMQILSAKRVPPSAHSPTVSPALDAVALKALSIDPKDRYQTCAEMKQAIEDAIWQSRCGAKEVEAHMKSMFAERIDQRRVLLSRATRDSFSDGDLEIIGAAFREQSGSLTPMPRDATKVLEGATTKASSTAVPVAPSRRRWPFVMVAAIVLGAGAAVFVASRKEPEPAKPVAAEPVAAAEPPVVAGAEPVAAAAPAAAEPAPAEIPVDAGEVAPAEAAPTPAPAAQPNKKTRKADKKIDKHPAEPAVTTPPPSTGPSAAELTKDATARYMKGDFIGAEATYKRAIAADRSFASAHRGLGFVYQRAGNNAKAIESLRTYLKLAPGAKDAEAVRQRIEQMGG